MDKYTVIIKYITESATEGYYLAYLPDFGMSACSSTADTREEAIKELEQFYKAVVNYYLEVGKTIPMPIINKDFNDIE